MWGTPKPLSRTILTCSQASDWGAVGRLHSGEYVRSTSPARTPKLASL